MKKGLVPVDTGMMLAGDASGYRFSREELLATAFAAESRRARAVWPRVMGRLMLALVATVIVLAFFLGYTAEARAQTHPMDLNPAAMGPPPVYSDEVGEEPMDLRPSPQVASGLADSSAATSGRPFREVFGIPPGFRNAGVRKWGNAQCLPPRHLVLDLNNCGRDPDGRRWCANKCE